MGDDGIVRSTRCGLTDSTYFNAAAMHGIAAVMIGIRTNVFTLHLATKIRYWHRSGKNWSGDSCVLVHCLLRRLV